MGEGRGERGDAPMGEEGAKRRRGDASRGEERREKFQSESTSLSPLQPAPLASFAPASSYENTNCLLKIKCYSCKARTLARSLQARTTEWRKESATKEEKVLPHCHG
jgi:hypothetical protein